MASLWIAVIGTILAVCSYYWQATFREKIQDKADEVYDYIIGTVNQTYVLCDEVKWYSAVELG